MEILLPKRIAKVEIKGTSATKISTGRLQKQWEKSWVSPSTKNSFNSNSLLGLQKRGRNERYLH